MTRNVALALMAASRRASTIPPHDSAYLQEPTMLARGVTLLLFASFAASVGSVGGGGVAGQVQE